MTRKLALCAVAAAVVTASAPVESADNAYRLLSTSRTTTLQEEIDKAAAEGYQLVATAGRGGGQVVLMRRSDGAPPARYRVLGTTKIDTMQKELQDAAAEGFCVLPGTMLSRERAFGPPEIVVFLEIVGESTPGKCEYRVVGTSRTGTMEEEVLKADEEGFAVIALAQASELATVLERRK